MKLSVPMNQDLQSLGLHPDPCSKYEKDVHFLPDVSACAYVMMCILNWYIYVYMRSMISVEVLLLYNSITIVQSLSHVLHSQNLSLITSLMNVPLFSTVKLVAQWMTTLTYLAEHNLQLNCIRAASNVY